MALTVSLTQWVAAEPPARSKRAGRARSSRCEALQGRTRTRRRSAFAQVGTSGKPGVGSSWCWCSGRRTLRARAQADEAGKADLGGSGAESVGSETSEEVREEETYKPASTSWGMFERPNNISKAYGGGKNIPFGGERQSAEEIEEKRKKTLAKIQQYRKKRLALENSGLEDDTLTKAKEGIQRGKILMLKGSLSEAKEEFQNALKLVSPSSSIGGEAQLQLAICVDSMGRYEEAKEKYKKLTTHRDFTISRQAENFLFGFDAQEMMKTEKYKYDSNTYRPYFDVVSTGEWDTMYVNRGEEDDVSISAIDKIIVSSVFVFPVLLIIGLKFL